MKLDEDGTYYVKPLEFFLSLEDTTGFAYKEGSPLGFNIEDMSKYCGKKLEDFYVRNYFIVVKDRTRNWFFDEWMLEEQDQKEFEF